MGHPLSNGEYIHAKEFQGIGIGLETNIRLSGVLKLGKRVLDPNFGSDEKSSAGLEL